MNISLLKTWLYRYPLLCAFVAVQAAGFLLFANSFDSAWTYDDLPVIVNNPDIRSWGSFLQDSYAGRPLRELTFLLDHALFGLNPAGWHLQQIFWHALNAFLLFALLYRLAQPVRLALLAAGLFLAHPLTVEVAVNLSHRKDSLVLAGLLLAIHAYLTALRSEARWPWLLLTLLGWGVALLAKENALILPGLLLLLELTSVAPDRRLLAKHRWAAAVFAGVAAIGAVAMFFYLGGAAAYARAGQFVLSKLNVFGDFSLPAYLLVLLKSWAFMLLRVVLPVNLGVEYTYAVPAGWFDPWVLGMLLVLAGLGCGLALAWRHQPLVAFALGWVVLLWLPVANLWPGIYFAADRYLYAPLLGCAVLAAWLFCRWAERLRPVAFLVAAGVLVILSVLTWRQNDVWESEFALWSHALEISPESVYALNNLGVVYGERRDWQKAVELIGKAAENPYYLEAQLNMVQLQQWLGNPAGAQRYRQRASNPHQQQP